MAGIQPYPQTYIETETHICMETGFDKNTYVRRGLMQDPGPVILEVVRHKNKSTITESEGEKGGGGVYWD